LVPGTFNSFYSCRPLRLFALFALVLCAAFFKPLSDLARLAAESELHSHILLIPFVSAYLIWLERKRLLAGFSSSPVRAVVSFAAGLAALAAC
jgi:hypothetical protein